MADGLLMREATSGTRVFYHGELTQECDIYLCNSASYPYRALIFKTKEEAKDFSAIVESRKRPGVCAVLPMEEIRMDEGETLYLLPCEKAGRSLTAELRDVDAVAKFYDGEWLTEFSKDLLIDSLLVISNFIGTPVTVSLHPDDIYVRNNGITIVGLSKRKAGALGSFEDYRLLAGLIEIIFYRLGKPHRELTRFAQLLRKPGKSKFAELCREPIFWTKRQMMDYPAALWAVIENSWVAIVEKGVSPFGERTIKEVSTDDYLKHWYDATDGFGGLPNEVPLEYVKKPGDPPHLQNWVERQARRILAFQRKCFHHFEENKDRQQAALAKATEQELFLALQEFFPESMHKLFLVGCRYEADGSNGPKVVPRHPRLKKLVVDDFDQIWPTMQPC